MDTTQRLTKDNRPDKRAETSRANAEKARLTKLEKLAEKKRMIMIDSETDSDSDSERSSDEPTTQQVKRRVGRPPKEEELKQKALVEAITDATARAIKLQELERKAAAKSKREAVRKAKADGTYVNKGRGRPFKKNEVNPPTNAADASVVGVEETKLPEKVTEQPKKTNEPRGAFVFC